MPASEFLELPPREGLTHVLDKGLGLTAWRELLDAGGDYIDIVKLGWGTSYVTQNLDERVNVFRAYDKPVCVGGTFLERRADGTYIDEAAWAEPLDNWGTGGALNPSARRPSPPCSDIFPLPTTPHHHVVAPSRDGCTR